MSEYLLGVVGIVLFASVLLIILPDGRTTELIKNLTRIACLVVILTPIVRFFVGRENVNTIFGESGIQTETSFINYCREQRIEEAEEMLQNELSKQEECILDVKIVTKMETVEYGFYESEELKVEKIIVFVSEAPTPAKRTRLEEYVLKSYGCLGMVDYIDGKQG